MKTLWILLSICSAGRTDIHWSGNSEKACHLMEQGLKEEYPVELTNLQCVKAEYATTEVKQAN